ncbi:transposase [Thioalkalivibrio sulfidiphilus]|uniref:transposase n=1 Tax=Thioalkalivibrio sulfidiphilus TaxID=1033854 RepID=UPI003BAE690B
MTRARRELVHLETTSYYHCISRCVRRAFLCGRDVHSGRDFEHRRGWVLERVRELQSIFAVEVCAYAVMSNHYHLVLRVDSERAGEWSDDEVAARWARLFSRPVLVDRVLRGERVSDAERDAARRVIAEWRTRLVDLSWFMRSLNEHLARRANQEDGCKGRFWEGRFKCQALLDEAAVLTCMSYVDLNPIRAGMAHTPEDSDFTSVWQRILELTEGNGAARESLQDCPDLVRFDACHSGGHANHFVFSTPDYLELVDWCGRAIREDKRGAIPAGMPSILARLNIDAQRFLSHVRCGRRDHQVVAMGRQPRMREAAARLGRNYFKGQAQFARLYLSAD